MGGAEQTQDRRPLKRKIFHLTLVACAAIYFGQQSIQAQGAAPGGPGGKADWLPANKTGFGTSHTTLSKVWFTLEGGRLSEVYYPNVDTPSVRNLDFIITDGHSFAVRAQDASTSTTRLVGSDHGRRGSKGKPDSLTYQIINADRAKRWRLTTTFVTDPARPTLLIDVEFISLDGQPYDCQRDRRPSLRGRHRAG